MDNDAFEDGEKLPGLSRADNKKLSDHKDRSVLDGLFIWREILGGFVNKNPKTIRLVTILVVAVAYHAYFFYCLFR